MMGGDKVISSTSWIVYGMIDGGKIIYTVIVLFTEMIIGSLILTSLMMDISYKTKMVGTSPPKEQKHTCLPFSRKYPY